MHIGVLGISHRSANLEEREIVTQIFSEKCLNVYLDTTLISFIPVITCNRLELYFSSDNIEEACQFILKLFYKHLPQLISSQLYYYLGEDCFKHLSYVVSGFDSAMLGETEIQGQVKKAYHQSMLARNLSSVIHFVFQKSLKIGKDLRSQYQNQLVFPNLEKTIYEKVIQETWKLKPSVLFIGASETNYNILYYFYKKQAPFSSIAISNRSTVKDRFANFDLIIEDWEKKQVWANYDVVIIATKSPHYLITLETFDHNPCKNSLFIDLSVPRNVDPRLENLGNTIYNIEQLHREVQKKQSISKREMGSIKAFLYASVLDQIRLYKKKQERQSTYLALLSK